MLFVIGLTHWAKRFRSHGEKAGLVMFDPEVNVSEILKSKKASIKNAALPPGSPSWDQIQELTWAEVEEGAQ